MLSIWNGVIKQMITISSPMLIQITQMTVFLDFIKLGHFDHINLMITLSVIRLSGFHSSLDSLGLASCCFINKLIIHWKDMEPSILL